MEKLNLHPSSRLEPAPTKTPFDYGMALARVSSLALPFMGPGVTLLDTLTTPLRGKRMDEWCEELRLKLNELSSKMEELTPESLATNDAFVSAFAQATQAALKTHQKEKLSALRNVVLNVAAGGQKLPSDDLQLIFLNLIDRFTPIHLRMLEHIGNRAASTRPSVRNDVANQVVQDLNNQGLLKDGRPYAARDRDYADLLSSGPWEVSSVGKAFLEFVKTPVEAE